MSNPQDRLAENKTNVYHNDEINGGFDPKNKLYQFVKEAFYMHLVFPFEKVVQEFNFRGYPLHAFHKDKNGIVRSNLCDVIMYADAAGTTDFCKKLLENIAVFGDYEELSHFGHHLY